MADYSRLPDRLRRRVRGLLDSGDTDLEMAHERLKSSLRDVESAVEDVASERTRLDSRIEDLREDVEKHNDQARRAVQRDRDDLARQALEKKQRKVERITRLEDELDELRAAEDELLARRNELAERVEEFRTEKERIKAQRRVAEAEASVKEATASADDAVGTRVGGTVDDVQDAEARAAAMDELREEGVYDDPLEDDDLDRELDRIETDRSVENELETLRDQHGDEDPDRDDEDAA